MGAPSKTHKVSGGRLVANPTDLTLPLTNCGGTVLGTVDTLSISVTRKIEPITAEEWGSAMVDGVLLDEEVMMNVTFSTWDEDAAAVWAYGGSTGSGVPTITAPGSYGGLVSALRGVKLLWLPNDDTASPAILAYNAIPWTLPRKIDFNARKVLLVESGFLLLRDASNNTFKSALLGDL